MKKLFFLLGFYLLFTSPCFANCNYLDQCPKATRTNAGKAPAFIEQMAQNIFKNEIKKATGIDFDVTLEALSFGELLSGKFKSLTLTAQNVEIEGIHFSYLKIQTMCDFASFDVKSKPIKIRENFVLKVWVEATGDDIRNIFSNAKYSDAFNSINFSRLGIASVRLYPSTISIEDGKLYFSVFATPSGPYQPTDLSISADLRVQDERITASKIEFVNLYTGFELTQFSDFLEAINNLSFSGNIMGSEKSQVQIQNINMVGDRVYLDGMILIPKT